MLQKTAKYVFWISIIFGLPIFLWLWSVGVNLQKESIHVNKLKLLLFKFSILFPIIYFIFGIFYLIFNGDIIMPLHLCAMVSVFYSMIFAAKTLKSAELNKEAKLSDYLGDFFLIWFYPLGIWILQPRIHNLQNKENNKSS